VINLIRRINDESYDDFMVRLFEHKSEYELTWPQITEVMNDAFDMEWSESKYRTEFKAFNRGRIYEREKCQSGIVTRILSISDLHIPFQKPIETFSDYIGAVDILQINGDVVDFSGISKFPKVYRSSPMDEIIAARQYLVDLIDYIRPKKVVAVFGNHDLRFQSFLVKSLDSDLVELMPRTPLDLIFNDGLRHYDKRLRTKVWYEPLCNVFDDVDVQYTDNWHCQIGETVFCHPLAFKSGIMKTANDAMLWFRNEGFQFSSLIMAHTHRLGEYTVGNTTIYEQGACCDTDQMMYADGKLTNSQKQGYIYICQDKDGKLLRDFTKLVCLN
jgi:hypothetical protein